MPQPCICRPVKQPTEAVDNFVGKPGQAPGKMAPAVPCDTLMKIRAVKKSIKSMGCMYFCDLSRVSLLGDNSSPAPSILWSTAEQQMAQSRAITGLGAHV